MVEHTPLSGARRVVLADAIEEWSGRTVRRSLDHAGHTRTGTSWGRNFTIAVATRTGTISSRLLSVETDTSLSRGAVVVPRHTRSL